MYEHGRIEAPSLVSVWNIGDELGLLNVVLNLLDPMIFFVRLYELGFFFDYTN